MNHRKVWSPKKELSTPAARARARAPPLLRSNTLDPSWPSKFGSERSGVGPEFEKGDGRLRPSLQQRLPGAEGPPEGCSTAPRHAACGGPIPSSAERPCVILSLSVLPVVHSSQSKVARGSVDRTAYSPKYSLSFVSLWCTCVSASASQSRAQCCARELCCKILYVPPCRPHLSLLLVSLSVSVSYTHLTLPTN